MGDATEQAPDLCPGMRGFWRHEPRGGYGYVRWVPIVVRKVGPRRVTVEAQLAAGGSKLVSVNRERVTCQAAMA